MFHLKQSGKQKGVWKNMAYKLYETRIKTKSNQVGAIGWILNN